MATIKVILHIEFDTEIMGDVDSLILGEAVTQHLVETFNDDNSIVKIACCGGEYGGPHTRYVRHTCCTCCKIQCCGCNKFFSDDEEDEDGRGGIVLENYTPLSDEQRDRLLTEAANTSIGSIEWAGTIEPEPDKCGGDECTVRAWADGWCVKHRPERNTIEPESDKS